MCTRVEIRLSEIVIGHLLDNKGKSGKSIPVWVVPGFHVIAYEDFLGFLGMKINDAWRGVRFKVILFDAILWKPVSRIGLAKIRMEAEKLV